MENRRWLLISVAIVLAAAYVVWFTDWLRPKRIQVIVMNRPVRQTPAAQRKADQPMVYPVSFAFDQKHELTSIKVVSENDFKNEKFPTPLWHVISTTNSRPTKAVVYGITPPGMTSAVEDALPQPLQPGTIYVVQFEAGKLKGMTNFTPLEATPGR